MLSTPLPPTQLRGGLQYVTLAVRSIGLNNYKKNTIVKKVFFKKKLVFHMLLKRSSRKIAMG